MASPSSIRRHEQTTKATTPKACFHFVFFPLYKDKRKTILVIFSQQTNRTWDVERMSGFVGGKRTTAADAHSQRTSGKKRKNLGKKKLRRVGFVEKERTPTIGHYGVCAMLNTEWEWRINNTTHTHETRNREFRSFFPSQGPDRTSSSRPSRNTRLLGWLVGETFGLVSPV